MIYQSVIIRLILRTDQIRLNNKFSSLITVENSFGHNTIYKNRNEIEYFKNNKFI